MKQKRSAGLVLAGYFLARCTQTRAGSEGQPPSQLGTKQWRRAYLGFYDALGAGRGLQSFSNSLKNSRDGFDGHFSAGRVGWRSDTDEREPRQLSPLEQAISSQWSGKSDEDLWAAIAPMFETEALDVPSQTLDDIEAEDFANEPDTTVGIEGGQKYAHSRRFERNPRLRNAAVKYHGLHCQSCGFDFQKTYGELGKDFIEVHHSQLLAAGKGKPVTTDPKTDLAVVCSNCHRMLHRKRRILLTISELRAILAQAVTSKPAG
jgi:5-methylcytosine-specific restriction protein A